MKQILVATDGSAGAALAAEEGVWLAKAVGADVIFAGVVRAPLPVIGNRYYQRALTSDLAKVRGALADAAAIADERRVPYQQEILNGHPATAILDFARQRDVDLIVVGSRGRGGVSGAVLGSVSTEIVHGADRPVLVVRPTARTAVRFAARMAV